MILSGLAMQEARYHGPIIAPLGFSLQQVSCRMQGPVRKDIDAIE